MIHPSSKFMWSILILRLQSSSYPWGYWGFWGFGVSSWSGYGHWFFIAPWSKFWLYHDFEGAKQSMSFKSWGLGRCWRFLTGIWDLHVDLDMVTGHWYIQVPNFGSLTWFWKVQRSFMTFKSWFGALQDTGGSWFTEVSDLDHDFKGSLYSDKHVLKVSYPSAKIQLRYLLS